MSECEHNQLELDMSGTRYECYTCHAEFELPHKVVVGTNTEVVSPHVEPRERGDNMSNAFDASSLPSSNTVSRDEAGAWIARQAEEQGIGNSFKVFYNDAIMGKLEDLPEQVSLDNLRVSAALDQATWFTHEHTAYACDSLV